jgi:ATP phosphoribosyltransferase
MYDEKLIVGMPAGSLADSKRGGNLVGLLKNAGFPTRGYEVGGPSSFPLHGFLIGWDGRPQEFGSQLAIGEIDVAIAGDDWIRERVLELKYEYGQEVSLNRVMSLERGRVRIVVIKCADTRYESMDAWLVDLLNTKPLVTMVSEMPYLALEWFQTKAQALGFGASHNEFSVQKFKTPPRIASGIVIYETWGKTEAKVKQGSVDLGLEITQTGSAIRNYGLEIAEEVLCSETSIWASAGVRENPMKLDLARMLLLNIYGSVFAENKVILLFNVRKDNVPRVMAYLQEKKLFADEPTINEGVNFTEFNVQLDVNSTENPIARVRYELAQQGATNIETIPLDSAIPGLDVIRI